MTDQLEKIVDSLVPIIKELSDLTEIPAVDIAGNLAKVVYDEMVMSIENYEFPGEKTVIVKRPESLINGLIGEEERLHDD